MIFVLDVGNTNIKCGLFQNGCLEYSFRISTNVEATSDEYGVKLLSFFSSLNLKANQVKGMIISSVIPSINYTLEHMAAQYFGLKPLFVGPGIKTGINIKYDPPKDLGTDRIVNAVAAYELFGGPCITVDFGTATSFGAISEDCEFLGGAICPGIKIAAEALTVNAAKLPRIELVMPESVICRSTICGMQAGILYGYVGQVEFIINKMKEEMGAAKVVATGGLASIIVKKTDVIDEIVPTLTLIGLYKIYEKNM
jgi:type III pantothenate kinase